MNLNNYTPAKEAAESIGISYSLFMSRLYNKKVKFQKAGWAVYIPNGEVKRLKDIEAKKKAKRSAKRRADASNAGVEGTAR